MLRFWADSKGSMITQFAVALIPVLGVMGAAIDYSRANLARTKMQVALDATGLFLSKLPANTTQEERDAKAVQYFFANYTLQEVSGVVLTATPGELPGQLNLTAKGTYTPKLVNVLGIGNYEVGTKTQVKWGIGKVEVALALDNTGSMSGNKITQLKIAAHDLLNVLQNAAQNPGDAKVSIVPFGKQVKLDTAFREEFWLKWGSQSEKDDWTGCVEDRNKDYDVSDTVPVSSDTATLFPGEPSSGCGSLAIVMPLSYDWTALHAKIDTMIATGNTNIPIGLAWAWHTLSPTLPFTEGAAYGTEKLTKFVILLTDGDNTDNRWDDSTFTINQRTTMACNAIKAVGIKIYTVRVINGNASLLQSCASSPSMYFDVDDAGELSSVFNAIGSQIANLHLSQ
jgi:Flp pilus assembly protein TadG